MEGPAKRNPACVMLKLKDSYHVGAPCATMSVNYEGLAELEDNLGSEKRRRKGDRRGKC